MEMMNTMLPATGDTFNFCTVYRHWRHRSGWAGRGDCDGKKE